VASKGGHICIVDVIAHTIVYDSILSVKIAGDDDEEVLKNPELSPITSNITMLKFVRSYPPSSGNGIIDFISCNPYAYCLWFRENHGDAIVDWHLRWLIISSEL
jgi:hypothetical protein